LPGEKANFIYIEQASRYNSLMIKSLVLYLILSILLIIARNVLSYSLSFTVIRDYRNIILYPYISANYITTNLEEKNLESIKR
jgi:hypothetical protein